MNYRSVVLYRDRLFVLHSFKMDPDFVVINPLSANEEDELFATVHTNQLKSLGIFARDVPGCDTLDDLRKYYPEFMI